MTDTAAIDTRRRAPAGFECQEASPMSHNFYIACGKPAEFMVRAKDGMTLAMCAPCADHNVKNRGAKYAEAKAVAAALVGNEAPGFGDNTGTKLDQLRSRVDELIDAANAWLKQVPEITDEELAGKCEGFIGQVAAEEKAAEAARKAANEPHRVAVEANNKIYQPLTLRLTTIRDLLKPKLAKWLQVKRDRLEAERRRKADEAAAEQRRAQEAARLAEKSQTVENVVAAKEAADRATAAVEARDDAAAAKATVKGEFSARARGLRTVRRAEIVDQDEAYKYYRSRPDVREVLHKLANQDARAKDGPAAVPGVRFYDEETLG